MAEAAARARREAELAAVVVQRARADMEEGNDGECGALDAGGQRLQHRNRSLVLELRFHIAVGLAKLL